MNTLRPLPSALDQNPQESAQPARRQLQRRAPAPLALEQRVMFDGAALDTVMRGAADAAARAAADAAHGGAAGEGERSLAPLALAPAVRTVQAEAKRDVVFIEDNLPDYLKLADSARTGAEVVVLDHTKDGLQQMIAALQGRQVDAIHLVTHGANGQVDLGSTRLSVSNVDAMAGQLAQLGQSLSADGDLLLYGCDVAGGEGGAGSDFLASLARHTGADVAASSDTTGSAGFGNWTLEAHSGSIDVAARAFDGAGWQGELANTVFDAAQKQLSFKNAVAEKAGSTGTKSGDVMRFKNVITIGGQVIDAIVTTTTDRITISNFDSTTEPSSAPEAAAYFQPITSVDSAGGSMSFKFDFVLGGTQTGVTVQNFVVNSYDIDSAGGGNDRQFQEFKGFSRYELSTNTELKTEVRDDGSVKFEYNTADAINYTKDLYADLYRVQVYYDSASSLTIRAGANGYNGKTFEAAPAHFSLEFMIRAWKGDTKIVGSPAANLVYSNTTFNEAASDGGVITATSTITLNNGIFAGTNGQALDGVVFQNKPAGLDATVVRTGDNTAELRFSGAATAHANANDVTNFGVSFGNAAFKTGNAGAVTGATRGDLVINFNDDTTLPVVNAGQAFSYAENQAPNTVIGTVAASDVVGVTGFRFVDSGTGESNDKRFTIDAGGTIRLTAIGASGASNDFELLPNGFTLAVQARDLAGNWSLASNVILNVTNIDEAAPAFTSGATATVSENQNVLYTAQATDTIDYTNRVVSYALDAGSDTGLLQIDSATGVVRLASGSLDFETRSSYSFAVRALVASGNSSVKNVIVTVANIDEVAPAFTSPATATVNENQNLLYTAQASDNVDYTNRAVTYALDAGNDAGLLQIDSATGVVRLASGNLDFEAKASYGFTVRASDATGNVSVKTVTVAVANTDEVAPAFISPATATVNENQNLLYTAQASDNTDYTDKAVTYALEASGDASLLQIDGNTGVVRLASGNLDFETKSSYSFIVRASDASGNVREQAVTIAVANIDEVAPAFTSPVAASANENQNLLYSAQASDSADYTNGVVSYALLPGADAGLLQIDSATGAVRLANGNLDFESKAGYSFSVSATDVSGNVRAQSVSVAVHNLDDAAPVFSSATTASVNENQVLLYTAQASDSIEATDGALRYTLAPGGDAGLLQIDAISGKVSLVDGKLDVEAKSSYDFTVVATDASGNARQQTVTVSVANIDEVAPAFTSGASASVNENQNLLYTAQALDKVDYTDRAVRYSLQAGGDAGLLQIDSTTGAVRLANGKLDFEAKSSYSFTVVAQDASGNAGTRAVTVNVADLNEAPVAANASVITAEDTALHGQLPGYLDPDGDSAAYVRVAPPLHGSVEVASDGRYVYTPAPDYFGADSFTYAVEDGRGGANSYRVDIAVTPVNDAPVAGPDTIHTQEDTAVSGRLPTAVDAEGDLAVYTVETSPAKGLLALNADGTYSYTPLPEANGSDSFVYRVSDGKDFTLHTVTIEIGAVNDAPVAGNASIVTLEDTAHAGQLPQASDIDNDPVRYDLASGPAHGEVRIGADGRYVYTPAADFHGADSFSYRVSDGQGGFNVYTVGITVNAVNDAPTAADAAFVTREDEAYSALLPQANDIDGDPVAYALAEQPEHGSVSIGADGRYTYTPAADYNGADRFRYTVSDGRGGSNTYTVEITVTPVNDAPLASPGVAGTATLG